MILPTSKATGGRNAWIEIPLSSCWLQTKRKYSFSGPASWQPSRWCSRQTTGWPHEGQTACKPAQRQTRKPNGIRIFLPLTVNGPWPRERAQHWEAWPALVCRHPNEFHVRSIKSSEETSETDWIWQRGVPLSPWKEMTLFRMQHIYWTELVAGAFGKKTKTSCLSEMSL